METLCPRATALHIPVFCYEVYLLRGQARLLFDVDLSDSALINTHLLVPMLLFPVFPEAGHCPNHAGLALLGYFH